MTQIESEGEWFAALPDRSKLLFLVVLCNGLTIAGRNSYEPQTDRLERPEQLRKINEIQHRVSACMRNLLTGHVSISFEQSIVKWVLAQTDAEFGRLMSWTWHAAKERMSNAA